MCLATYEGGASSVSTITDRMPTNIWTVLNLIRSDEGLAAVRMPHADMRFTHGSTRSSLPLFECKSAYPRATVSAS